MRASLKYRRENEMYRSYVADSLHYSAQGMFLRDRYTDILHPRPEIDVDEIIDHVASAGEMEVVG